MKISYLPQANIDKQKWDRCIDAAPNALIYAYSFYLDGMSKNWDALILNDYEIVMPLTWNKKYGVYYLYQPFFTKALGIFGNISDEIVNVFLHAIPKHFKYLDIDFKEYIINPSKLTLQNLQLKQRDNFLLDLNKKYEEIYGGYKRLAVRMLKKAAAHNVEVLKNRNVTEVIEFYQKYYSKKHPEIKFNDYKRLTAACNIASGKTQAATYVAEINGQVVAVYLVLKDDKFIYSLIGGSNKSGKDCGAFYLLTDAAIKDHAGTNRTFRFEGSDKKGIAFFNMQFNPLPINYYHLTLNKLPWPIKFFKKN